MKILELTKELAETFQNESFTTEKYAIICIILVVVSLQPVLEYIQGQKGI
jgi:hypothetical protein